MRHDWLVFLLRCGDTSWYSGWRCVSLQQGKFATFGCLWSSSRIFDSRHFRGYPEPAPPKNKEGQRRESDSYPGRFPLIFFRWYAFLLGESYPDLQVFFKGAHAPPDIFVQTTRASKMHTPCGKNRKGWRKGPINPSCFTDGPI